MSINVTVNGNPVCIRRRVVLSDVEQIKKNERERRKRLRLEQVRQQSKEISSKLLDRAKNIARKTLNDIENDKDSELRRMHDKRVLEIQQKYQDDMENIGLAHTSATAQPDAGVILENEKRKNLAIAAERGKEATQRLRESGMQEDPIVQQQERLRQVREVENVRSAMIANLAKKSPKKVSAPQPSPVSTTIPSTSLLEKQRKPQTPRRATPKKKKHKSIEKNLPRPNVKVTSHPTKRVVVEIHQEDECPTDSSDKPRKKLPVPSRPENIGKIEKIPGYDPTDYQGSSTTSSPSLSDDSSYFSDGVELRRRTTREQLSREHLKQTPREPSSKVQLYDHNTRQRKTYERPQGLVERIDVHNEPSAIESAQQFSREEQSREPMENHRVRAQVRGANAIIRERLKKEYADLLQKLDFLSREERKLKASQANETVIENKKRRQERKDIKQAEMNRFYETSRIEPPEKIITIDRNKKDFPNWDSPSDSLYERSDESTELVSSRNEEILEMLKKVERQKRSLLEKFGASLPDSIFNASMTRLFDNQQPARVETSPNEIPPPPSPEIKIIRVNEQPKKIETAVQTSKTSSPEVTQCIVNDKSIQVELTETFEKNNGPSETTTERRKKCTSSENISERISHSSSQRTSEPLEYVEPIVKIIHPEVSSSDSSGAGIVIDFSKQQVKVTPTKRKTPKHKKRTKSLPSSGRTSPVKKPLEPPSSASVSAPTSRMTSPQEIIDDEKPKKFKLPERLRPPCDTSTDISFVPQSSHRPRKQYVKQSILKKYSNNTSDTSTSYASLPAVQPGSSYIEPSNVTPILQMLDSSANESVLRKFREREISPVSTPETPSPRTMRIPSNMPDPERLGRVLRFDESQEESRRRRTTKSSRGNYSEDPEVCKCQNPACRLVHQDMADLSAELLSTQNPATVSKYDELQNICAERIASLTALIKQVRDEKQEDYSLTAPSDETSLMQMPTPRPRDNLQSVQKLVESIEAIHSQLAKTLQESQKIITGSLNAPRHSESPKKPERSPPRSEKREKSPQINEQQRHQIKAQLHQQKSTETGERKKPKVVSDETVRIDLHRFKQILHPKHASTHLESSHQDDTVEKISQEILEQTKSSEKEKPGMGNVSSETNNEPSGKSNVSPKPALKQPDSPGNRETKSVSPGKVPPKSPTITNKINEEFVPLLAGIPKIPRALPATPANGRRRPPPVVHQGIENFSPPHELSTIAEFDTPDTANRSQMSMRSPEKQLKQRAAPLCTPVKIIQQKHEQEPMKSNNELPTRDLENVLRSNKSSDSDVLKEVTNNKLITSSSSHSFSGLSGISEILSTPTSDAAMWASSPPEHMEDHLRSLGLGWAVPILRKTRQAGALSSSSSSDVTILATIRKKKSPVKKNNSIPLMGLDFSDVSSISIREASKSTERAVLMKARTSTPNIQISNCSSPKSTTHSSTSGVSRDESDSINLSLKNK